MQLKTHEGEQLADDCAQVFAFCSRNTIDPQMAHSLGCFDNVIRNFFGSFKSTFRSIVLLFSSSILSHGSARLHPKSHSDNERLYQQESKKSLHFTAYINKLVNGHVSSPSSPSFCVHFVRLLSGLGLFCVLATVLLIICFFLVSFFSHLKHFSRYCKSICGEVVQTQKRVLGKKRCRLKRESIKIDKNIKQNEKKNMRVHIKC